MEDEVCYSTVTFRTSDKTNKKSVLYAEVKRNEFTSEVSQRSSASAPISPSCRRAAVFLGLLCVLLLSAFTTVSVLNYNHVTDYNNISALYNQERTLNQQLLNHKDVLEKELNGTLDYILKQSTFSVEQYCYFTEKRVRCKPCPTDWIQNGSSCYYFFQLKDSQKTWLTSQEFCKTYSAHLAIIDSVEEQEFVNQHTKFFYDKYHGYWIGLSGQAGAWVWTGGAKLDGGFWLYRPRETNKHCVLSITSRDPVKSWQATRCQMLNRWICEMTVLKWPKFLRA